MASRARVLLAPAYLFACLILGGSAQGIWPNMVLQLAGVAIIAWSAMTPHNDVLPAPARQLLLLGLAVIAVAVVQSLPMPPSVWSGLGARAEIARGFQILEVHLPWQPLSLAPAATLDALFRMIPALAMLCAMLRLRAYRGRWLAVVLLAGTFGGVALGAMQVADSRGPASPLYFYGDTSVGKAVGFFANADHMAMLLVVTIPFLAAVVASSKNANMQRYSAVLAVAAGLVLVILIGIALNGSLAGLVLAFPVSAASVLLLLPRRSRMRLWLFLLAVLLVAGSVVAMEATAIGSSGLGTHAATAVQSRTDLLATTLRASQDFFPWGSGLGSFQSVYSLYESARTVTGTYVVHAHNDYAEVALELGLAGVLLMALFLAWWAAAVWRTWRTAEAGPFARAAAISSAAILIHSLVDFPLRTAAMSALFAMCLALLADRRASPAKEKGDLRRRRHVEFT